MEIDPDYTVKQDYAAIREDHSELLPWELLSETEKDRIRKEYKRHNEWMNNLGEAIRKGNWDQFKL